MPSLKPESMVKRFFRQLPKMPTGEIDYNLSDTAVVVTVFVMHLGKILLVKRGHKVSGYRGKWNAISGYVDEIRPISEIALKEIHEEVGIGPKNVKKVIAGKVYSFRDKNEGKRWVVCPYLVQTKIKPKIKLDWENTDFVWIAPSEIVNFDVIPNLQRSLERSLSKL